MDIEKGFRCEVFKIGPSFAEREDLEIAKNLEISVKNDVVRMKMEGNLYANLCRELRKLKRVLDSIGCPLGSSIAIAIVRSTGKPVVIEKEKISEDGETIETVYRIIG